VLDVGCGTGEFLDAMRQYGHWDTLGLDVDERSIAYVREVLKIEAYVGRLGEIAFADDAFDAITMWDTLEHIHNPRAALAECWRILRPGGHLLIRVPSLDSLDARLFGPYWSGLDAPRHLTVFSRKTVKRLLSISGFHVQRLWCMSGSHASFVLSLRFLLKHRKRSVGLQHLFRLLSNPFGSLVSAPLFFVIGKLTLGPEITVLASKPAT
jgi:2-polyprenyl-3-methyl-5-hydroxy-6-metoxy-1,4-benzoquinol methylase